MEEQPSPLEAILEHMGDAVNMIADSGEQIGEGRLLTAAAWLRRGRRILRDAQDLLGVEIRNQEGGPNEDSSSKG